MHYHFNPLTSRSDLHVTSPYNIHTQCIIQQTGHKNKQTYQKEVVILL